MHRIDRFLTALTAGTTRLFRRAGQRHTGALCLALAAVLFLAMDCLYRPRTEAAAQAVVGKPPQDVQDLLSAVDDIDTLRVLNPLKLTPDQIDKIREAIRSAQADYEKRVVEIGTAPLRQLKDEIQSTKQSALAGKAVPKAFDDKVKKVQDDILKKREQLNIRNLATLSANIQGVLTREQIDTAAKLARAAYERLKAASPKTTDTQYFNSYVEDIFIKYPRIVSLLSEMRMAGK